MQKDQQQVEPPFSNDPKKATREIVAGFFLIFIGFVVGSRGANFNNAYLATTGIIIMLIGLGCFSVADARTYGMPPAFMSFRSVSYPFVWIAVKLRSLYRWNLYLFDKSPRKGSSDSQK